MIKKLLFSAVGGRLVLSLAESLSPPHLNHRSKLSFLSRRFHLAILARLQLKKQFHYLRFTPPRNHHRHQTHQIMLIHLQIPMKHRHFPEGEESGPTCDTLRHVADTRVGECPIFYYFFKMSTRADTLFDTLRHANRDIFEN